MLRWQSHEFGGAQRAGLRGILVRTGKFRESDLHGDVTPEIVIRVHRIIQMEKPAHTQHYLRFEADEGDVELREFFSIGLRSGIGIGAEVVQAIEGDPEGTEGAGEDAE